jgi:hypothetical protein
MQNDDPSTTMAFAGRVSATLSPRKFHSSVTMFEHMGASPRLVGHRGGGARAAFAGKAEP